MISNIQPNQISLFDSLKDRNTTTERERERAIRHFHIKYNDIISIKNLLISWEEFVHDKKNKKDVIEFQLKFLDNIYQLHHDLKNKTYYHSPYKHFKISDPKSRDIHKAEVRDRLLHHAIYRILYPYFDKKFIHDSYSCRIGKGTHRAMNRFKNFAGRVSKNNTKTCWVLKCDIKKFFANIDHQILIQLLEKYIPDKSIIWLLEQVIKSFPQGLPLGNLTSQLLVNIYMNEFDQFVKHQLKEKYYIRYADDFVFFLTDKSKFEQLIFQINTFITQKLKLNLHPNKVFIQTYSSGIDFLGWIHFPTHRILRTSTKRRILRNTNKQTKPETAQSYLGLLRFGNSHKFFLEFMKKL